MQVCTGFSQGGSNCFPTGPDFDDCLTFACCDCRDDAFYDVRRCQEVLTKSLSGSVIHCPAISAASFTAAIKLPASAVPFPAISRAVP